MVLYTLARVVANLASVHLIAEGAERNFFVTPALICDGLVRPLAGGCGMLILYCRFERLSQPSLCFWTRGALYCLSSCHCDVAVFLWGGAITAPMAAFSIFAWGGCCHAIQMQMSNLKLHVLGLKQTARLCQALTGIMVCAWVFVFVTVYSDNIIWAPRWRMRNSAILIAVACTVMGLLVQFLGLCFAAGRALSFGWHDSGVGRAASFLYVNAMLLLLGPFMSIYATNWLLEFAGMTLMTVDICFQVVNVLLLSGLVGPQQWQNPMAAFQKLATLQGFGLAAKRIAVSGHVNENARDCIVSFPGKYSQEALSLACVFLTDRASGLGAHCDNPDEPGECWCRAIYGHLPASTYISVVDMRPAMQNSQAPIELEFKRADAVAMGQRLATCFGNNASIVNVQTSLPRTQCRLHQQVPLCQSVAQFTITYRSHHMCARGGCSPSSSDPELQDFKLGTVYICYMPGGYGYATM